MPPFTLLYSGFDTVDFAVQGCLQPEALAQLAFAQEAARKEQSPKVVQLGPGKVPALVLASGRRGGYKYQINTGVDGAVFAFKNSHNPIKYNFMINIGSNMLLQNGFRKSIKIVMDILKGIGSIVYETRINRVDYCFDYLVGDFIPNPDQVIAPSNSQVKEYREGQEVNDQSSLAYRGRKLETLTIGKLPRLQIQIYNKRREVIVKKKPIWFKEWGIDPNDTTQQIWRIEIRAGKEHLKGKYDLISMKDIEDCFGDVVYNALQNIRYIDDDQDYDSINISRARLHPIWEQLQNDAQEILYDKTSGLLPNAIKDCSIERMNDQTKILLLAYARRYAISIEMSETQILENLSIEIADFIQNSIEKDPDDFLYKTKCTAKKYRFH